MNRLIPGLPLVGLICFVFAASGSALAQSATTAEARMAPYRSYRPRRDYKRAIFSPFARP
jgi:hypothetical protein